MTNKQNVISFPKYWESELLEKARLEMWSSAKLLTMLEIQNSPVDIFYIADRLNINTWESTISVGTQIIRNNKIFVSKDDTREMQRFYVASSLGLMILYQPSRWSNISTDMKNRSVKYGINLLMPEWLVRMQADRFDNLSQLSGHFIVSHEHMQARLKELRIWK